ncbi:hypothetical protein [Desulfogranum marinum]|uniref:hypothetical protein n=1 Tax=Desulfogranum marinum TaxID=453220 RepID=UPI0019633C9B|nr:hypothetical protein [Desulfogranum marinum]MBM9514055.1 hypothetical protein [Desulfogranum marinum]
MDIETRLAAIEEMQNKILALLSNPQPKSLPFMNLKEAADYVGYSYHHFRRLAVEQRMIPFSRPSGQQKGKVLFKKADLDKFITDSTKENYSSLSVGRRRKSKRISYW